MTNQIQSIIKEDKDEMVAIGESSVESSKSDIKTKVVYVDISTEEKGNIIQKKKAQFKERIKAS